MKILLIMGTRPEAIKLFPLVLALRARAGVQAHVCVTGQHRQMMDQFLKLSNLVPETDLNVMEVNQTLTQITTKILTGLNPLLEQLCPDRVVVQGDTTSAFAGALAAFYRKIPVSHVEAGLRSGDNYGPWPEEGNRRMVSTLADQHFAPTEAARENLLRENIPSGSIHVTGNTVIDTLLHFRERIGGAACGAGAAICVSRSGAQAGACHLPPAGELLRRQYRIRLRSDSQAGGAA